MNRGPWLAAGTALVTVLVGTSAAHATRPQSTSTPGVSHVLPGPAADPVPTVLVPVPLSAHQAARSLRAAVPGPQPSPHDGAGDFNGDGKPDLAARKSSTGELFLRLGNGTIASGAYATSVLAVSSAGSWDWMDHGDITGDGLDDLVFEVGGELRVRVNRGVNGTSTFASGEVVGTGWGQYDLQTLADVDEDGRDDLVLRRPADGIVYVRYSTGSTGANRFGARSAWLGNLGGATYMELADVTGDDALDLVYRWDASGSLNVLDMNADQSSTGAPVSKNYTLRATWGADNTTMIGDVDLDGHPDLVFRHSGTGDLRVVRHGGSWNAARPKATYGSSAITVGSGWNSFSWLT